MIPDIDSYESRLRSLSNDLFDSLTEGAIVPDEIIQNVVERLLTQFKIDLDSSPKAKQDFIHKKLSKWGSEVLHPLTALAEKYFRDRPKENGILREELTRQIDTLQQQRDELSVYMHQQQAFNQEDDDRYLEDL